MLGDIIADSRATSPGIRSPVAEDCILLFYGASFAARMQLPANPEYSIPMMAHLPIRYVPVFAKGCMDAMFQGAPVQMQGTVDRGDGSTSSTGQRSPA